MISSIANKIDINMKKIMRFIPSASGAPLTNKWFLYLVFACALYEMFSFFMRYDFYALSIFVIVGFLASFFSKNMAVILIMAIVLTRLIRYGQALSDPITTRYGQNGAEGFADDAEEEEENTEDDSTEEKKPTTDEKKPADTTDEKKEAMTESTDSVTSKLLENQKQLMANMEALKPVLKQAESFLAASNEKKMDKFTTLAKAY
jgi:hypothetical protein